MELECYSIQDYLPFVVLLFCRIFVVGVKYGIFSDEHMEILRRLYLTDDVIDYYLVLNQTNNDDTDVHLNNINEILENMEIDEKIFYIKVYKN